jgi:hypothetical protein
MLQSKIAAAQVTEKQNNTAIDECKGIDRPDNHSEWYPIEVGTERANLMACGNAIMCVRGVKAV